MQKQTWKETKDSWVIPVDIVK